MKHAILTIAGITFALACFAVLRRATRNWRRQHTYRRRIVLNQAYWDNIRRHGPGPAKAPRLRIIVSMTSSPTRLPEIEPVLNSLTLGQTRPPDELHLNLPWIFGRTGEEYVIPDFLARYPVKIFRTEDVGPATKLVPTLERVSEPDTWIMTVDDDVRHLPTAIERLEDAAIADPETAHGYSDYALWRKWEQGKPVDFLAGFAGCIYKRDFFGPDFTAYFAKTMTEKACFFQDDIVIGNYLALNQVASRRLAMPDCHLALMKSRGCLLEQAGGGDALSHGAGSGMDTKTRSLTAMAFLRSRGLAAKTRD